MTGGGVNISLGSVNHLIRCYKCINARPALTLGQDKGAYVHTGLIQISLCDSRLGFVLGNHRYRMEEALSAYPKVY